MNKNYKINIIIFSCNRASQLELFLRSMKYYFKEFYEYKINILYTYSNDDFKKGYDKLISIHNDNNINYIKESDTFKNHIISLLDINNTYSVFFVDDIVFKNEFTVNCKQFKLFSLNEDILALSLRLHPYLNYCYSAKLKMTTPNFDSNLIFKWCGLSGDYGYPMSLDGHFFRTSDILSLTKILNFNNPNSYESLLSMYTINRSKLICFEDSIIINNPINKVQNFNNNYHGNISSKFLNDNFLDNNIIDFEIFKNIKNISCHKEIDINFVKYNYNDKVSIAIAAYEMHGIGDIFLKRCIDSIINQTYSNIEIVVSDHSTDDKLKKVCDNYNFDIKYIKNDNLRGYSSANFNNAIKNSTGEYIKILCQDDFLYDSKSIENTINAIKIDNKKWLVSSYYHTYNFIDFVNLHHPKKSDIYQPIINLIGTHSCLTISKDVDILFDDNLIWYMDCEYYSRLFEKYSQPEYLLTPTIVQSLWEGQVTNSIIDNNIVKNEIEYIKNKNKL